MTTLAGERTVGMAPAELWERLADPDVLAEVVPGCQRLERAGPGQVRLTVTGGAGALRGTWAGTVEVVEAAAPRRAELAVDVAGGPGSAVGALTVDLTGTGEGGTTVAWEAELDLRGMPGRVGGRLVRSLAERTAGDLLAAVEAHGPPTEPAAEAAAPVPGTGTESAGPAPARSGTGRPVSETGEAPEVGEAGGEPTFAAASGGTQSPEARRLVAAFLLGVAVTLLAVALRRRRG